MTYCTDSISALIPTDFVGLAHYARKVLCFTHYANFKLFNALQDQVHCSNLKYLYS